MLQAWLRWAGGQGLEQAGDLGRVHAVQQLADALELAARQRVQHRLELAAGRGGGCVGGRCGGVRRVFGLVLTGLVCERGAQLRTQVREHAAFQCAADLLPQRPPALGRKALEQGRDLGRMHSLQQLAHTLVAAVDERLDHLLTERMRARFLSRAGDVVVMAGFVVHAPKDTRPQAAARRGRGALTAPAR